MEKLGVSLLVFIALVGVFGLVGISNTGAMVRSDIMPNKPTILDGSPFSWDSLFGIAGSFEEAFMWCPNHKMKDGGFLDVLQRAGSRQFRCFVVPPEVVPEKYKTNFPHLQGSNPVRAPVACFFATPYVRPQGFEYPVICDSGDVYKPFYDADQEGII